eukprot:TRINITY_DN15739_c0_g1_i1.p2 TRINITY_DN15739_c0_g1~~TRINITY_DN15739_c0_g1_i1.p2  ORF type:complete len:58 (+),score=12.31 TRINITY_DN15739_c0_g1_i1:295-468(+)
MCLGLGDVYLGACCAVPVDPRHRFVVPKSTLQGHTPRRQWLGGSTCVSIQWILQEVI